MLWITILELILAIGIFYTTQKKKQECKNIIHITNNMFNSKFHNRVINITLLLKFL